MRYLAQVVLLGGAYFAAGRLAQFLSIPPGNVSVVWPSSGIALGAILLGGGRLWPGIWLGAFLVNSWPLFDPDLSPSIAASLTAGAAIATGSTLQALAGGRLMVYLAGGRYFLDQAQNVFRFAVGAVLMCLVSSTVGTTSLALEGLILWDAYSFVWRTWWLGDLAGVLVFTPLLLAWLRRPPVPWDQGRVAEAAVYAGLLSATTLVVFGGWLPPGSSAAYLTFPTLIWAAFRFGQRGTTAGICSISILATWGTGQELGPFHGETLQMSLLLLQAFASVLALSTLALAAVIGEGQQVAGALDELNRSLEQQVAERSAVAEQRAEELARSAAALREQARTLQSVLDNILEGIVVADARGKVVLWNPAAEQLVGIGQDTPLEEWPSHFGYFLPDQVTPCPADGLPLARALRGETVRKDEMFVCNASQPGGLWLRLTAVPLRSDTGESAGGVVVFRDISESKQEERRLQSITESILAGIIVMDEEGRITQMNRQAELIFDYPRDQLYGRPIEVLVPEHLRQFHRRHVEAYLRGPQARPTATLRDIQGRRKDGQIIDLQVTLNSIRQDGDLLVLGSVLDVTEQKQASDLVKSVVELSPDGILMVDRTDRIVLVNQETERMFGYAREELLGQPLGILVPERFRERHHGLALQFIAERRQRSMNRGRNLPALRKDGSEFPADISLHSYELNGETYAVATIRDISERLRLLEAVETNLLIQNVISKLLQTSHEPVSPAELLDRTLELIVSVPWFATRAAGAIFLTEGANGAPVLKAQHGLPPEILSRCVPPSGRCLCGRAAQHREVVFVGGPDERDGFRHPNQPPHAYYCIPILHGECYGALLVCLENHHSRRSEEDEFLSSAARILAGTIERKRAEEALRQSEARFRAISEAAPLGIFLTDAEGDCLYTNRAYLELTGRAAEEPLGKCWRDIIHPEDRDLVFAKWYQAARDRLPFELTYRFVRRDGRTIWVSGKSAEVRVGDTLTGYVQVVEDITEAREATEALRRSEERFDLAVRGTDAGIWDWDIRANTVYLSPRWKSMLGYAEDEVRNALSEWESRLHPDDRDRALTAVRDYLEGQSAEYELEHRLRHKDGSYRWILARGAAVHDPEGRPYRMVGSHIDITDHKQTANQLSENLVQLRAAQRIQQTLLPKQSPILPGLDIAGFSDPAAYAGGDMFDYLTMLGGHLGVVIGDVSGHGIGAALQMASTSAFLRSLAQTCATIGEIMTRLNGFVCEGIEEGFITLALIRIDLRARTLTYANAGHPPIYVLDAAGNVRVELGSSTLPLGIEEHLDFPVGESIALQPGNLVVLVTDGILEAESPEGIPFGKDRLLETIRSARDESGPEILKALRRAVGRHSPTHPPGDDLTAVVIKLSG